MGRALVTGATGFIGSNLVRKLVHMGDETHVLTRPASNPWRIRDLSGALVEHQGDLLDPDGVRRLVSEVEPRVIFHCATYGGRPSENEPERTVEVNTLGTLYLLHAAAAAGVEGFVNSGSSSEYGRKDRPMSEDDLLEPQTLYGAAKAASTLICQSFARSEDVPVVTVRPFSPYGPREAPDRLVPYVIKSCLSGEDPLLASGSSARDFVYIDDVVDLYVRAAQKPYCGEVVNCGSGRQHSVEEVVTRITELTGAGVKPRWGTETPRPFESSCWVADISKAGGLYGWVPRFGLSEGLLETISWQRSEHR